MENQPKRSLSGCVMRSSLFGVAALVGGIYLLGRWERLNGTTRAAAIVLVLVSALFLLPLVFMVVATALKIYFRKKITDSIAGVMEPARKMVADNKAIYVERHEYRPATDADFIDRDRAWYDAATGELTNLGYTHLGDVVNETVAKSAGLVVVLRRFASADGTNMSALYQYVRKNSTTGAVVDLRVCDVESELSDGSFLTTSNAEAAKAVTMPPQIRSTKHPAQTTVPELIALHEEAKAKLLAEQPELRFTEIRTLEEYDAAQQRQQAIKAAFRQGIGYLDPEEVRRIAEQRMPDDAGAVAMATVVSDVARREEQMKQQ